MSEPMFPDEPVEMVDCGTCEKSIDAEEAYQHDGRQFCSPECLKKHLEETKGQSPQLELFFGDYHI